MHTVFIKKVSVALFVIGLITFIYYLANFIFFFEKVRPITLFSCTLLFIFLSLFGLFYGIKKQNKKAMLLQIGITFLVAFLSILASPSNPAAMVFLVINFILLDEYGFLQNKKTKICFIFIYSSCFVFSILLSEKDLSDFISHFLLFSFFFCFMFVYVMCKQTQDVKKLKKCMRVIEELKKDNEELIQITREQLIYNTRQSDILERNSEEIKKVIGI